MSAGAVLFYGYDLGSPESEGWKIEEADFSGRFRAPWMGRNSDESVDYSTSMTLTLLKEAGARVSKATHLSEALAHHCGVVVVRYGHLHCPGYGLALTGSVYRAVNCTARQVAPNLGGARHVLLEGALEVLGMSPLQLNPSWILAPEES